MTETTESQMFCALRTGSNRGRSGSQVAAIHAQAIYQNELLNGEPYVMRNFIVSLMRDEQGQDLIESALISIFLHRGGHRRRPED
jgi:hypothetical protein